MLCSSLGDKFNQKAQSPLKKSQPNFTARFMNDRFHLSDQRLRFLVSLMRLARRSLAQVCREISPLVFKLIQRAYQRWLLNAYRFSQLNLRLVRRQLMNIVQRDPNVSASIPEA
ncbi:Uncharacterised protein [Salmonella enterica subsp. enterica]|uniref:Uncharacterized protein n=1 Tax=Salmonella enterica I TaxID=59201 RepID=A0A379VT70_SALET|nr:Uncharacterised protein [Salmonella enterica subsp. enterica]